MDSQTQPSFFFISEHELNHHLKSPESVFKINLYSEKLDEEPLKTIYIKLLESSKMEFNQIEDVIRSIIKDHASYALAFKCESLALMK